MGSIPTISTIMPAYNTAKYIDAAIESILSQTFADFEFVIVDDGSTDDTVARVEAYADPRIRLLRQPENQGIVAALNAGLEVARGRFIARQDADDISLPERFEKQVDFLNRHPETGLVGCWYAKIDDDGQVLVTRQLPREDAEIRAGMKTGNHICHGSVMFRRELLDQVGRYRDLGGPVEDLDLWLRFLEVTRFANLPEPLFHYRVNPNSIMSFVLQGEAAGCVRLLRKIETLRRETGKDPLDAGDSEILAEREAVKEQLRKLRFPSLRFRHARHYYVLAEDTLRNGDLDQSLKWVARAIRTRPYWWLPWRLGLGLLRRKWFGRRPETAPKF